MKIANIKQNRFAELARLEESIFHIGDLAKIWRIESDSNLRITIKRYVDAGLIYRLYRGLYSLKKVKELDPAVLGAKAINAYCYLSAESVLAVQGVIFQKIDSLTFLGGKNKRFEIASNKYYCRQLKDAFLYNNLGIIKDNKVNIASLARAVADILYFNPRYHFDNPQAIDWEEVKKIQRTVYNK